MVAAFSLLFAFSSHAAEDLPAIQETLKFHNRGYSGLGLDDPTLTVSGSVRYFGLDGRAYAREGGTKSEHMRDLDLREQLGVSQLLLYDFDLDLRPSKRNHLSVEYFWGEEFGAGQIGWPTGFNDRYYADTGQTDGGIALFGLRVGWDYRVIDRIGWLGRYKMDLGAGVFGLKSYEYFATEKEEEHLSREEIWAPFTPYASIHSEWQPNSRFAAGMDLKIGLPSPQDVPEMISEEPAQAKMLMAELNASYALTDWISLRAGMDVWNLEIDFDGVEDDKLGHTARNETELWMTGGYIGVSVNEPQQILLAGLKSLFR